MTKEILTGNKIIHDWMGHKRMKPPFEHEWIGQEKVSDLKYHSSWDWFMPAYFKFRDYTPSGRVHMDWCINISLNILHDYTPKKAASELVEAIKWYNTQPN